MYCGIVCYKSLSHSQCSEAFYKECVQDELFSRSTQFSDGANSVQEKTSQILKKARSAEEESEEFVLDSDDEEELSDRLANVDLDDSDQVWKSLTAEERRDFQKKLNSGELYKLVPHEERNEGGVWWGIRLPRKKVTDISSDCISDGPGLHTSIPPLVKVNLEINTRNSSPLVKCNLMNALFAYAVAYRHFRSWHSISVSAEEAHDFLTSVLNVSSNLSNDENFTTAEMAIASAETKALQMPNLNPELVKIARSDVVDLVVGPGGEYDDSLYLLASLSDLKSILTNVLDNFIKNENYSRKRCVLVSKKIEYFICWVQQHAELTI